MGCFRSRGKTMNSFTCPECGHDMCRNTKPFTVTYGALSAVVDMPGWYCTNCQEAVFVGADMDAAEKARQRLKAQAEGLLLPEEIRRIRRKLRLTQMEAGTLLGGGQSAFHKYETGAGLPSQAISNLLRWLAVDPRGLEIISRPITRDGEDTDIDQGSRVRKRSNEKATQRASAIMASFPPGPSR
jgi:HTH-type transcriptional regulator/antitoxin MqsA